jgi:hypothetical protein
VHVPHGRSARAERPSSDQCLVLLFGAFDDIGYHGPGGRVLKPALTPFVISRPVGRATLAPEGKGAIVEHDRLADFVTACDVLRLSEAHAEAAAREFKQSGAGRDRSAVVVDHTD